MRSLGLVLLVFAMACMLEAGRAFVVHNLIQAALLFIVGILFGIGGGWLWERRR